jgi:hypothetical protein
MGLKENNTVKRRVATRADIGERFMLNRRALLLLAVLVAAVGCANRQQMLDQSQAMAMQTAVNRGQFEMNCSSATGVIISREVVQPVLQGPFVNGIPRAEYTVGVEGCNKRTTFVVVCPQGGGGCFATGPGRFIGDQ